MTEGISKENNRINNKNENEVEELEDNSVKTDGKEKFLDLSDEKKNFENSIEENNKPKKKLRKIEDINNDSFQNKIIDNDLREYDIFSLARHGRFEELESLFLKGVDPDSKDQFGNTILIVGAQNGNKRIVKLALRYGSQINMFNIMGNTALHFCNEYNYSQLSKYLLSKGALPNIKNIRDLKATEGIRIGNYSKTNNLTLKQASILKNTNMNTSSKMNFMNKINIVKEIAKDKPKNKKINII